ncbi:MAG: DUF1801 domain-containing protein [Saprospiraceae bacterium]|nr:DUF1801 domain-containing protein [Saprospiraceae bacterium]
MAKDINDPQSVTAFIQNLEPDFAKLIEAIRQLILSTDPEVGEQIKWNSPSFFYQGEMKAFNAKEYKRDIVVVNIRKGIALLVFPTGAIIEDQTGLLEGDYTDGRRLASFKNMKDIEDKGPALQQVIRHWLAKVEK